MAFENDAKIINNEGYYLPNVELKDYNVMIDGKNFFDQPVKNNKATSKKIFEKLLMERAIQLVVL